MVDHRPLLPGAEGKKHGRPRLDDRMVLNGIFFVLRTGTPWRDLPTLRPLHDDLQPPQFLGQEKGIWLRMFETLAAHSPQSLQLIDSSIIRAHQHAAGGKRGSGQRHRPFLWRTEHQDQCRGRSGRDPDTRRAVARPRFRQTMHQS